jgi:hypothetical protein
MDLLIIIVLVVIILIIYFCRNNENFTEGTYKHMYSRNPDVKTNLTTYLYPTCQSIRKNMEMKMQKLYKNKNWILTTYPSYFYSGTSTSVIPNSMNALHYVQR